MAEVPTPRHLTIEIDFDLSAEGSTVQYARAHAAYEAAVKAAIEAAREVLPSGCIQGVTSQIDWSYRWQRHSRPEDLPQA